MTRLTGLIAAVFSPADPRGDLDTSVVPALVDHVIDGGVSGLFVGGSTGEGPLLTHDERRRLAEAYVTATAGRVPVIVQVGHESTREAAELAAHAQSIGADAIAAAPPCYFKPGSVDDVVACLDVIARGASSLPLYYYHIPRLTGVDIDIETLLEIASDRLPGLAGVKYSDFTLDRLQRCIERFGTRYDLLFGADEMLLHGLVAGAHGAVGSTYNFAGRLYGRVVAAYQAGDLATARDWQDRAIRMVQAILRHPTHPALRETMRLAGVDCGPPRLPLRALTAEQATRLESDLRDMGFFEWIA